LILFFYDVNSAGIYTPISLTDYDIYIYKAGFQYGSITGGVTDSSGNNYPGYNFTAPLAVAYYNSFVPNWIDCNSNAAIHYIVNGHALDCGWVPVSYWENDGNGNEAERFTAPNICLPYYTWPNPLAMFPGNVNFNWPVPPTEPYNWYSFTCGNSTQQLIIRGVLPFDTSGPGTLAVKFANENVVNDRCIAKLSWSNLTESDINYYSVERSANGAPFQQAAIVFPLFNNNTQADYEFPDNVSNIPGILLYRLKAIENSGKHFYSITLKAKSCSQQSILTVYPNPAIHSQFTYKINDLPYGHYQILLVNDIGQEAQLKVVDHIGGPVSETINKYYIPTGTYFLVIRSKERSLSQKIIITD